jgi:DNA-binding response OmpR family regulator
VARALEDSLVLRVDEKTLIARLHQDPSLAFRLIRLMAQRVYNLEHQWVRYVQCGEGIDAGRIADSADPAGPAMLPNVFDFSIGYHILIVEDDTEFYHLLERWLSRGELGKDSPILPETVRLLRAVQIQEALSHLCHDKFDVVILDLNLPDSQGMESFRRVHDRFPDTPIVVLSAMDDDQQAIVAVRQGAQDYLVKSTVNRERLLHSVRYAVERRCVRMGGDGDDASRTGNRRDPAKRTSGSLLACVRAWLRRVWERRRF